MSAKEATEFKLEKFKNRKQIKPSVKNRKTKNMTPEQLVGQTAAGHKLDIDIEDGTVYTIMLKTVVMMLGSQMKKIPLNMHCLRMALYTQ